MLTKQEIFDIVAKHLLTQKVKSQDEQGICLYRGPNDLKCAIGALIKDEFYDSKFEEESVLGKGSQEELLLQAALKKSGVDMDNTTISNLCGRLQKIHDGPITFFPHDLVSFWYNELKIAARDYKLDAGVLKALDVAPEAV